MLLSISQQLIWIAPMRSLSRWSKRFFFFLFFFCIQNLKRNHPEFLSNTSLTWCSDISTKFLQQHEFYNQSLHSKYMVFFHWEPCAYLKLSDNTLQFYCFGKLETSAMRTDAVKPFNICLISIETSYWERRLPH